MSSAPLTSALFVPRERLGWQYVDPGGPHQSPQLAQRPVLYEPLPPSMGGSVRGASAHPGAGPASLVAGRGALIAAVVVVGLLLAPFTRGLALLAPVALMVWLLGPWIVAQVTAGGRGGSMGRWQAERALARERYERDYTAWERAIAEHDAGERRRLQRAIRWQPVNVGDDVDRVDVVGGVADGWRRLLATFGAGVLAQGRPLLAIDMTGDEVLDGLTELATEFCEVRSLELPRDREIVDPLVGLPPAELAEVLTEAVDSLRGGEEDRISRALDGEVLRIVAERLAAPVTATRLAAGLQVLQRTYEPDELLSAEEVAALTRQVDAVAPGERGQEQLRFLRIAVGFFAQGAAASSEPSSLEALWLAGGLTAVSVDHSSPTTKDATERVIFHALMRRLRLAQVGERRAALVIAGADHLGATALETLAKQARRRGVLLVYMFEHLRDDTRRLVGTAHSATIFMRLGNGTEAAAAAEHIGRRHSFQLAQITRQLGTTDTIGGSQSEGTSTTSGSSQSAGVTQSGFSVGANQGSSFSESVAESSQTMSSWSRSTAVTEGTTEQRVYEFAVEQTELQSLPASAFILVEGRAGGTRAVAGDCNPSIALLEDGHDGPAVVPDPLDGVGR